MAAAATSSASDLSGGEKKSIRSQRRQGEQLSSIYRPVLAQDVRCVSFKWARLGSMYNARAASVNHKGGKPHCPVIGDLAMLPQTGKYYYEIRINSDNCRIGLCTDNALDTEECLETTELGMIAAKGQTPKKQSSYLESIGAVTATDAVVAVLHGQTSYVVVNGVVTKQLWRSCIPSSGALFSFVVDTEEGVAQLFINKFYAGLVFDSKCNLKGRALFPCISLGGLYESARSMPNGYASAVVSPPHKFDCYY